MGGGLGRRTSHSWLPSLWFSRAGDDEQEEDDEEDDEEEEDDGDVDEEEGYHDHCHADHDKDSFENNPRVLNPGQKYQRGKSGFWICWIVDMVPSLQTSVSSQKV